MNLIQQGLIEIMKRHAKGVSLSTDVERPLTELGIDSMSLVGLLLDIEKTFELVIPDELLTPKAFSTIASIVLLIEHVQESKP